MPISDPFSNKFLKIVDLKKYILNETFAGVAYIKFIVLRELNACGSSSNV